MWTRRILASSQARESARLVLVCLGADAGKDGIARVSVPDLANLAKIEDRQVQYCLRQLVDIGEIELVEKGGGRGKPAAYRIVVRWQKAIRFPSRKGCNQPKGFRAAIGCNGMHP